MIFDGTGTGHQPVLAQQEWKGGGTIHRRIAAQKYLLALIFFALLFAIQSAMVEWSTSYLIQLFLLNSFLLLGIYAFRGFDTLNTQSLNSCLVSYLFGCGLAMLFALVPILFFSDKIPRNTFIITGVFSVVVLPLLGWFFMNQVMKRLPPKKYLVIGKQEELSSIIEEVKKATMGKIEIYDYLNPSAIALEGLLAGEKPFDSILIGNPSLTKSIEPLLQRAQNDSIPVEYLPRLVESTIKRVPLELIHLYKEYYEVSFSEVRFSYIKRVVDLVIAVAALIVLSPLFLVVSILILIEDGRPAIFKQKRHGMNGNTFIMHKFRSMKKNAEVNGARYATEQKDVVTKVGRFIRSARIDETPQFFDILRGTMSFIGPRPEQPCFAKELSDQIPYYDLRHRLKPGITGWAQTNFRYAATVEEQTKKLSYDLYYVKNCSIMLDIQIILRTVETVLFRKGAK